MLSTDRDGKIDGSSTAIDRIQDILTPYLGPHMTKVSLELFRKQLGINEVASPAQYEELIALLLPGLTVFVGQEKSATLGAEMRSAVQGD